MITEDQLKRFKEKLSTEKCDGEVTEAKLAGFIANYNRNGFDSTIFIEGDKIIITPSMMNGGMQVGFSDAGSKLKAMLSAMVFVMLNSNQQTVWFRKG